MFPVFVVVAQERGSFVGPQLPARAARPVRRLALAATLGISVFLLGACSVESISEFRWAMPDGLTEQASHIFLLWKWGWWAAMSVGVLVWGLIFYAAWRFRRRSDDEIPVQTRYNLPLEIFYTIAPIMMVIVFFSWTVSVQNEILHEVDEPDRTIEVVGQQWSWTFNHGIGTPDHSADEDGDRDTYVYDQYVYTAGTGSQIPTLWLPEGETVQFNLHSPDVIHSFWVPGFLMKLDVLPGQVNHFQVTPNETGTFMGKCAELCGVYHSRMLFNVKVVSPEEYEAYLDQLEQDGQISSEPLLGADYAREVAGLDEDDNEQVNEGETE